MTLMLSNLCKELQVAQYLRNLYAAFQCVFGKDPQLFLLASKVSKAMVVGAAAKKLHDPKYSPPSVNVTPISVNPL